MADLLEIAERLWNGEGSTDVGGHHPVTQDLGLAEVADRTAFSASFGNMDFTLDPIATSLQGSAEHAKDVGLLDSTDLKGIYDLTALNAVLSAHGQPAAQGL